MNQADIQPGALIDVEVNGERRAMFIVAVEENRVLVARKFPQGRNQSKWWLPLEYVAASTLVAKGEGKPVVP